jgi:Tfp pilus assembly protein PilX
MRHVSRSQRGSTLLVALVVLAVLSAGAVALFSSTLQAQMAASNTAFKQAALQASDAGVFAAQRLVAALDAPDSAQAGYFPVEQPQAQGVPAQVDWSRQPAIPMQGYEVRWVVERLCSTAPVTDPTTQCATATGAGQSSNRAGAEQYEAPPAVYYRATVRVTGPRNLETFTQALFSR